MHETETELWHSNANANAHQVRLTLYEWFLFNSPNQKLNLKFVKFQSITMTVEPCA